MWAPGYPTTKRSTPSPGQRTAWYSLPAHRTNSGTGPTRQWAAKKEAKLPPEKEEILKNDQRKFRRNTTKGKRTPNQQCYRGTVPAGQASHVHPPNPGPCSRADGPGPEGRELGFCGQWTVKAQRQINPLPSYLSSHNKGFILK